jgi:hypothetical protein
MNNNNEVYIKSLQYERRGYEARGLKDKVAYIDSILASLGVEPVKPKEAATLEPSVERAVSSRGTQKRKV